MVKKVKIKLEYNKAASNITKKRKRKTWKRDTNNARYHKNSIKKDQIAPRKLKTYNE